MFTVQGHPIGIGWFIALFVAILALIFMITGAPAHFVQWVFGLILALAIARMIP